MGKKKISSVDQMATQIEKAKPKKPSYKWLIILALLLVAIPLFIIVQHYMIEYVLPTPQRTLNQYFIHISREDYEKAYALLKDPFKASKGNLEEFAARFDLSRSNGTKYQKADILGVTDTNRKSVKLVSFQLNLRQTGRRTKSNGAYYLEQDTTDKKWYIVDTAM